MMDQMYENSQKNAALAENIRNPDGIQPEQTDRSVMLSKQKST